MTAGEARDFVVVFWVCKGYKLKAFAHKLTDGLDMELDVSLQVFRAQKSFALRESLLQGNHYS